MAAYDLTQIKNRYGIIGRDNKLDAVIDTVLQVAKTIIWPFSFRAKAVWVKR